MFFYKHGTAVCYHFRVFFNWYYYKIVKKIIHFNKEIVRLIKFSITSISILLLEVEPRKINSVHFLINYETEFNN